MARLQARGITLAYDEAVIARNIDFALPDQQITTIIGPNGCGKSTLLRGLSRLLAPREGEVLLDENNVQSLNGKDFAREVSLLPQTPITPGGITVAELVGRGRHPHVSWWRQWSNENEEATELAMRQTGVWELRDRTVDSLSGGQRQRVWIAMVLAQDTDIILLDEPTTYLDLSHCIEVLNLVHELNVTHGKTVAMVLHDLNLAARYSHHLVLMKQGKILAEGRPEDIITEARLAHAFGLQAEVVEDPCTGGPMIVPAAPARWAQRTQHDAQQKAH